jgi:L-asparaginase II
MTALVPLIEASRGGTPECQHFGAIAVVDTRGRLVAQAGDPHWLTFTRSTLKALQALPFMEAGGAARFGFTSRQVAMLCASHSGEPMHVTEVQAMLGQAGLHYRQLQCGCHVPLFAEVGVAPAPAAGQYDERHHNCSGKHAGFLAWCVQQGQPVENYLDPGHPLQQAIRRDVARAVGVGAEQLKAGIDGCSAPNYAMPLANLARGYARLASGERDGEFGASFAALAQAMVTHPDLVSGTGRNDLAFMQAGRGDWVTKVGADGVQTVGSRSRGQALAVKIADGSQIALHAATVAVLDQLGWLDDAQREALRPWRAETIRSVRGAPVGERRAVFALRSSTAAA